MKITLQGYEPREWLDKETGELVEGKDLHYSFNHRNVTGKAVARKFFSKRSKLPELLLGKDYILEYDEKGRVVQFCLADTNEKGAK